MGGPVTSGGKPGIAKASRQPSTVTAVGGLSFPVGDDTASPGLAPIPTGGSHGTAAGLYSLSHGHNSAEDAAAALPRRKAGKAMLSGSHRKVAHAIRVNCEAMVNEHGIAAIGFVTMTVGKKNAKGKFVNDRDAKIANRKFNNVSRRLLPSLFSKWIVVTERHKNGGVHFHLLGVVAGGHDIRTGFDFAAVKRKDYRSVSPALRRIWDALRSDEAERLGFGRCQVHPVEKTGEQISSYVSKYVEKNVGARGEGDKGQRLVRYHGWNKRQLQPNNFGWATEKACEWRNKVSAIAAMARIWTPCQAAEKLGARWAYKLHGLMFDLGLDSYRATGEERWSDEEITRNQADLAREWLRKEIAKGGGDNMNRANSDVLFSACREAGTASAWANIVPGSLSGLIKRWEEQDLLDGEFAIAMAWRDYDIDAAG